MGPGSQYLLCLSLSLVSPTPIAFFNNFRRPVAAAVMQFAVSCN